MKNIRCTHCAGRGVVEISQAWKQVLAAVPEQDAASAQEVHSRAAGRRGYTGTLNILAKLRAAGLVRARLHDGIHVYRKVKRKGCKR